MLKPLQAILDKILKQKKEEIKEMKKEWVVCSNCKYRGTLDEFLLKDVGDTTCPKCGEDITIFEL